MASLSSLLLPCRPTALLAVSNGTRGASPLQPRLREPLSPCPIPARTRGQCSPTLLTHPRNLNQRRQHGPALRCLAEQRASAPLSSTPGAAAATPGRARATHTPPSEARAGRSSHGARAAAEQLSRAPQGQTLMRAQKLARREEQEVDHPWWRCLEAAQAWVVRGFLGPAAAVAILAASFLGASDSALAADALKTCACLLENCRGELLRCLGDVNCAANIACLQACNGRPDETECQIGCGDLFANAVVDRFNACAVSEHPCVPRKEDEQLYPVPKNTVLVPELDVARLRGPWYISAGQNPTFDTFDCQLHTFTPTGPRTFRADLTWRIRTPTGGFFTRSATQDFVQQPDTPAVLLNHDNEFLHYQDDWYVISSKLEGVPEDYFFVYYRGSNDAWDGYGGAVLYTRSRTVPASILPEVERASREVGLDFDRFIITDNTCPPPEPLIARLEKAVEKGVEEVEEEVVRVEERVLEAGLDELRLLGNLGKGLEELQKDKEAFVSRLGRQDKELLERMEAAEFGGADDLEDLFGNAIPLRRLR